MEKIVTLKFAFGTQKLVGEYVNHQKIFYHLLSIPFQSTLVSRGCGVLVRTHDMKIISLAGMQLTDNSIYIHGSINNESNTQSGRYIILPFCTDFFNSICQLEGSCFVEDTLLHH